MRIQTVVGWSSRGISKDSLTRSSYSHVASPGLRKSESAKKMQETFVCHGAVDPPCVAYPSFASIYCRSVLIELRTSRAILPRSSSDSLYGVRELGSRLEVRLKDAFRCFYYQGGGTFFSTEVGFGLAINCYYATRIGHLELTAGIVWHRVESRKRGSSE